MAVGVAQNHNEHVFGRSYTSKGFDPRPDAKLWGTNLAEQFEYALQVDPEFLFITGWNEWTAGRYECWCQTPNAFPDEYDDLSSRDCEPARTDLKDHYYYQMCAYIRRFKGTSPPREAAPPAALTLASDRAAWDEAEVAFGDYRGNTGHRDEVGYGIHYVNATGRNDIVWSKAAHTDRAILITVACREELTPRTDPHWMRLYLRSRILAPTWEGFHLVVNRLNPTDQAVLEQSRGGWSWAKVARIGYRVDGNRLTVEVPRAPLGCDTPEFRVWFKWSDNTQADGDIMDVYSSGDTAPGGRFMYCYHGRDAAASPATSAGGRR